jgi:hypothetical protein
MQNHIDMSELMNHTCSSGWWDRPMQWRSLAGMTMQNITKQATADVARVQKKVMHKPIWTGSKR